MTIILNGGVSAKMLKRLVNGYNKLKDGDKLKIYLRTEGGGIGIQEAIVEFINEHKERITLVACDYVYSAGFNIFFKAQCERRIVNRTSGMIHYGWNTIQINETGKATGDFDIFVTKTLKDYKKDTLKFLSDVGLTSSELRKVRSSEDLYLSYERLCELLNNQNGKKEQ